MRNNRENQCYKEIAQNNGELDNFVPENVERKLIDKVKQMNL